MGDRKIRDGRPVAPAEAARTLRSRLTMQVGRRTQLGQKPSSGPRSHSQIARATTEPPPPPEAEEPGPRYVFMNELGRGGMGRVDEVFDNLLGRSIAQKSALAQGGESFATMLVSEAQTCAQLEHPAIVPVYDLGLGPDDTPFYTMRRIRGRTLYDVLRDLEKPASRAQLLTVLRQVCLAVDYAHSRGVVHRDLKPENVIVGEFGEVYVLDWGIAELLEGSDVRRALQKSVSAGSPGYMAPEQITNAPVDARTDVFALGAMLYEALTGLRLFVDEDHASIVSRATGDVAPTTRVPPGALASGHLESLVRACIENDPNRRPASARFIANAVDEHLDGERARVERQAEADALVAEGSSVYDVYVALEERARRIEDDAEEELAKIPPWESVETKQPIWEKQTSARRLAAEAARTLARAETAFSRALGRVEDHFGAREGLARLHFKQFEEAEKQGDGERMAQHLDLARSYDDGPLALELSNEGELVVTCSASDAKLEVARYEPHGWLLALGRSLPVRAGAAQRLEVGSWMVIARRGKREVRAPVMIGRAKRHELRLEWKDVPEGMILVPGGSFLAPDATRLARMKPFDLPDFAIGKFPVTIREYVRFLDELSPEERAERIPRSRDRKIQWIEKRGRTWRIADHMIEGEGKKRVPPERELDLPVTDVSWFDAVAYTKWLSKRSGLAYRLPTSLEWDKAARGVDGRPFPMAMRFDPSLAKLRESRPEASQPEPVGAFARDESPYGVRDMMGGVHEWTSTTEHASRTLAETDPAAEQVQAVIRGSAWTSVHLDSSIGRGRYRLVDRAGWVGYRVALDTTAPVSRVATELMKR
ncbi:MAG TPA: bifunctional serine/threonine-protein kinase/formylglycine-generating enzyme family protein [Polyangiaceae bacterium]|jgi:serine/threonine-protein kinase